MAIWILTQMKRWGHLKGEINYEAVAEQVYLASGCDKIVKELGYPTHQSTMMKHTIVGCVFDPDRPKVCVKSFKIHSMVSR